MTSKKIDLVLILFILFYILPVNSLKAYQRKTQGIDIRSFGAKDDGRTNILTALENASRKAQKEGTFVFIPKTNSSKGYYIDGNAKIYSSISSDGATITAPSKYNKILFLQSSGITIENLKFSIANDQLLVNAPIAIEINGMDNVKIQNCEIKNGRIYSNNTSLKFSRNISIINNKFNADFSNYKNYTIQNDIIQVLNVNGLSISDNSFDIKNSNRIIKVTSTDKTGKLFSENISITRNNIKSITNSKKQVIDLYMFTKNVKITDNVFDATGHNSIIENKTTADANYTLNLIVSNNKFITDGTPLRLYGSFGNIDKTKNGIQNVVFSANNIKNKSKSAVSVNIAHYQNVIIQNNSFSRTVLETSPHFRLAGIDELSITDNIIERGNILLTDEKVIEGRKYNPDFNTIRILRNKFSDSNKNALIAGVYNGAGIGDLIIEENSFNNQVGTLIDVKNSKVKSIQVDKSDSKSMKSIEVLNSKIQNTK